MSLEGRAAGFIRRPGWRAGKARDWAPLADSEESGRERDSSSEEDEDDEAVVAMAAAGICCG